MKLLQKLLNIKKKRGNSQCVEIPNSRNCKNGLKQPKIIWSATLIGPYLKLNKLLSIENVYNKHRTRYYNVISYSHIHLMSDERGGWQALTFPSAFLSINKSRRKDEYPWVLSQRKPFFQSWYNAVIEKFHFRLFETNFLNTMDWIGTAH